MYEWSIKKGGLHVKAIYHTLITLPLLPPRRLRVLRKRKHIIEDIFGLIKIEAIVIYGNKSRIHAKG